MSTDSEWMTLRDQHNSAEKNQIRALLVNRGFVADQRGDMSRIRKTGGRTEVQFLDTYTGFSMARRSYSAGGRLMLENTMHYPESDLSEMLGLFPAL